jgi:hypothetical protein
LWSNIDFNISSDVFGDDEEYINYFAAIDRNVLIDQYDNVNAEDRLVKIIINNLGPRPDSSSNDAITNKAFINLAINKFKEGWELYESRYHIKNIFFSPKPKLVDFNIKNKKIFIWAEQGIGDQILYSSLLCDAFKTQNHFYDVV